MLLILVLKYTLHSLETPHTQMGQLSVPGNIEPPAATSKNFTPSCEAILAQDPILLYLGLGSGGLKGDLRNTKKKEKLIPVVSGKSSTS